MGVVGPFLMFAGRNFGAGLLNAAGCAVATIVIPVIAPRIAGFLKGLNRPCEEEMADPDLC